MSNVQLTSNLKLITSNTTPTTDNLPSQNIAFGEVDNEVKIYGNTGNSVVEIKCKSICQECSGEGCPPFECPYCHRNEDYVLHFDTITRNGSNLPWWLCECGTLSLGEGTVQWAQNNSPWSWEYTCCCDVIRVEFIGNVVAGTSIRSLFRHLWALEEFKSNNNFDTSNVTDMSAVFQGCSSLNSLNISTWDTSQVITMENLFNGVSNITYLDISNFDTSNVTNMSNMFSGCNSLLSESFNISNFDTSNVVNMSGMFNMCQQLTYLGLSHFDVSNVVNMQTMFAGTVNIHTYNTDNWDTSNVTNMFGMFWMMLGGITNYNLTQLDLSHWDVSSVTNMGTMFSGNHMLVDLDVSTWDTHSLTNMSSMFGDCRSLTSFDLSHFDTSNVTDMGGVFRGCWLLKSLDISTWDTSEVRSMSTMFAACYSLDSLDLSHFNTAQVTNMGDMFRMTPTAINEEHRTNSLVSLNVSSFNTSLVTNMVSMFRNCDKLTSLDLSNFDTTRVTSMQWMFRDVSNLSLLDLSSFDTVLVINMREMFSGMSNLSLLDISNFDTRRVTASTNMLNIFNGAYQLKELRLGQEFRFGNIAILGNPGLIPGTWVNADNTSEQFDTIELIQSINANAVRGRTWVRQIGFQCPTCGKEDEGVVAYNTITTNSSNLPWWLCECRTLSLGRGNIHQGAGTSPWAAHVSDIDRIALLGHIIGGTNLSYLFNGLENVIQFDFLERLNTSGTVNMQGMFRYMPSLTSLNLSNFDTRQVTNMNQMFYQSNYITELHIGSNFNFLSNNYLIVDTAWVSGLQQLTTTQLINPINLNNVRNRVWTRARQFNCPVCNESAYFYNVVTNEGSSNLPWHLCECGTLGIDQGTLHWNRWPNSPWSSYADYITRIVLTGEVIGRVALTTLFNGLSNVVQIDNIDKLDVSNVERLEQSFHRMYSLKSLDLSSFDTSNVTTIFHMFRNGESLQQINLNNWDTSSVISMSGLFINCSSLTSLDLSSFDTSNIRIMDEIFSNCTNLVSLNLDNWNTDNVTTMSAMFWNNISLVSLTLGQEFRFVGQHIGLPAGNWVNIQNVTLTTEQLVSPANADIVRGNTWTRV